MAARNHHYLPQAYLKGFAAEPSKPQLRVFDLIERNSFITSVRNIGAQRDFNRVNVAGQPIDALESTLAAVESDVMAAIRRIEAAGNLENEPDLHLVLNLVGLIHHRNPRHRRRTADFMSGIMEDVARVTVSSRENYESTLRRATGEDPKDLASYEEMKEFVESGNYRIGPTRDFQIEMELSVVNELIPIIAARNWSPLRASRDPRVSGSRRKS